MSALRWRIPATLKNWLAWYVTCLRTVLFARKWERPLPGPPVNAIGRTTPCAQRPFSKGQLKLERVLLIAASESRFPRANACALQNRFPRRIHRELQRLFRNAGHTRSDQPAQPGRHVPRQRHRFVLQVNAAVTFFHAPPRFHLPQKSIFFFRRFLFFPFRSRVRHLADAHRGAPAVLPRP